MLTNRMHLGKPNVWNFSEGRGDALHGPADRSEVTVLNNYASPRCSTVKIGLVPLSQRSSAVSYPLKTARSRFLHIFSTLLQNISLINSLRIF